VPSQTGVKQGCPLSPRCSGCLQVGRIDSWLDGAQTLVHCSAMGTGCLTWAMQKTSNIKFVLLAESPQSLQALIDATVQFCAATGMLISIDKTNVVVFSQVWPGPFQWVCNGQPLECPVGGAISVPGTPFPGPARRACYLLSLSR
jgi:hypothetical protein